MQTGSCIDENLNFLNCVGLGNATNHSQNSVCWKLPLATLWSQKFSSYNKIFLTLGIVTNETAQAIASQQKALDSLARIVLDNKIALDWILAEKGDL